MKRVIKINSKSYTVNLNNPVARFEKNPILAPQQVNKIWRSPKLKVKTVHNAGVTIYKNNYLMLFRSHLRTGISILGLATSKKPQGPWTIVPKPALLPETEDEQGGVEDPRIIKIKSEYLITYSAYNAKIKDKVRVSLITTKDFKTFQRHGPLINKDARNFTIFSEKINNKYYAMLRLNEPPGKYLGGKFTEIRLASNQ